MLERFPPVAMSTLFDNDFKLLWWIVSVVFSGFKFQACIYLINHVSTEALTDDISGDL